MAKIRRPQPAADLPDWSAFPLSTRIGLLLRTADFRMWDLLQQHLVLPDITMLQYAVLALTKASKTPFVTKTHLCAVLGVSDKKMLSQTIPLVDRGLLKRRTTAEPPHCVSFAVTDLGRTAVDLVTSTVKDAHERLRREFTEREWEDGVRFLMRLSLLQADAAPGACESN